MSSPATGLGRQARLGLAGPRSAHNSPRLAARVRAVVSVVQGPGPVSPLTRHEQITTAMANVECRKFAPNIFNKSKCSNCFRLKEDHSASAIELNKASRKISKCGYLFVAPDWDFSNPINRTKRWQRRWFVLYDDGELTYSVDDHPETIPQVRN